MLQCVAVCCSVSHCVAVCRRVVQRVAVLQLIKPKADTTAKAQVCCRVLQCDVQYVAVCYSVLQCVAVYCSALQCVAIDKV